MFVCLCLLTLCILVFFHSLASMGAPSIQRRSIPCVLVDPATDINHLSLKDCFPRRSSTGRALPKIPIEQVSLNLNWSLSDTIFFLPR